MSAKLSVITGENSFPVMLSMSFRRLGKTWWGRHWGKDMGPSACRWTVQASHRTVVQEFWDSSANVAFASGDLLVTRGNRRSVLVLVSASKRHSASCSVLVLCCRAMWPTAVCCASNAMPDGRWFVVFRAVCNPCRVGSRLEEVPVAALGLLRAIFCQALQAEAASGPHNIDGWLRCST